MGIDLSLICDECGKTSVRGDADVYHNSCIDRKLEDACDQGRQEGYRDGYQQGIEDGRAAG